MVSPLRWVYWAPSNRRVGGGILYFPSPVRRGRSARHAPLPRVSSCESHFPHRCCCGGRGHQLHGRNTLATEISDMRQQTGDNHAVGDSCSSHEISRRLILQKDPQKGSCRQLVRCRGDGVRLCRSFSSLRNFDNAASHDTA